MNRASALGGATILGAPGAGATRSCVVTGAAGFIGSRLARTLVLDGWSVVGIDAFTDAYDPLEKRARAACLEREQRYRHVEADLCGSDLRAAMEGAEVVFHLAGRAGVRDSFSATAKYLHDNVVATTCVLEAACAVPSVRRLVYASSSSVYGNAELPFREGGPTAPLSPYGLSKLEAERLCLAAGGASLETVALRYFTVYGPGQRPDMGLRLFAEAAMAGRPLRLFGDGSQSRDFTFVDDVVRATMLAADAPVGGRAVNVGGGSRVSLLQVVEVLERVLGQRVDVEHEGWARGDARHTAADLTVATSLLGFRPRIGFPEGYAAEIAWLRTRLLEGAPA